MGVVKVGGHLESRDGSQMSGLLGILLAGVAYGGAGPSPGVVCLDMLMRVGEVVEVKRVRH